MDQFQTRFHSLIDAGRDIDLPTPDVRSGTGTGTGRRGRHSGQQEQEWERSVYVDQRVYWMTVGRFLFAVAIVILILALSIWAFVLEGLNFDRAKTRIANQLELAHEDRLFDAATRPPPTCRRSCGARGILPFRDRDDGASAPRI